MACACNPLARMSALVTPAHPFALRPASASLARCETASWPSGHLAIWPSGHLAIWLFRWRMPLRGVCLFPRARLRRRWRAPNHFWKQELERSHTDKLGLRRVAQSPAGSDGQSRLFNFFLIFNRYTLASTVFCFRELLMFVHPLNSLLRGALPQRASRDLSSLKLLLTLA